MTIHVPYYKQDTVYSCGAAAVQMILHFFGIVKSEQELIETLGTDEDYGTHHSAIIDFLRHIGLHCYVNTEGELEEIKHFIQKKLPVLVHYIEPDTDQGHYAVVTNVTDAIVVMNDPWNGEGFSLTKGDFESRWCDEAGDFPRWLLVAATEDFNIGKHYAPTIRMRG